MSEYIWLTEMSEDFLKKDYLVKGETVDERVKCIAETAESILGIKGFAEKFVANMKKGWYSLSSPIWANFGRERGLPISCFNSHICDTLIQDGGIIYTHAEVAAMTKAGGGTSVYFGDVRGRGSAISDSGESSGTVHFAQLFDTLINVVSQGKVRRGNLAAYWPLSHPDIEEVLQIRHEGHPIQDLSYGVCVEDSWLNDMIAGDAKKRAIWAKVLQARENTGYPYIFFTDNVNNNTVDVYKSLSCKILGSQLCSEVTLPSNKEESFVCCLSSMNVYHFDDWENDSDAVELLTMFLDAVMSEFITKAKDMPFMKRAVRFAERHRALGLGWLGWHSYLQKNMLSWDSLGAKQANVKVAKNIQTRAWEASKKLATLLGEPELLKGYGRRNTTLTAIAPTKSSAFILGQVSEGIEPHRTNYYIKDLAKGKYTIKNKELQKVLQSYGKDTPEIWESILVNSGSVQHLEFLSENEKRVFLTFAEIPQKEIIIQAAQRQKYVDQSQSLNLMIPPSEVVSVKDVNRLILDAWEMGIKTLYYQFSVNAAQKFSRDLLSCSSCES